MYLSAPAVDFSFSKDSSNKMAVRDFLFSVEKLSIKLNFKYSNVLDLRYLRWSSGDINVKKNRYQD